MRKDWLAVVRFEQLVNVISYHQYLSRFSAESHISSLGLIDHKEIRHGCLIIILWQISWNLHFLSTSLSQSWIHFSLSVQEMQLVSTCWWPCTAVASCRFKTSNNHYYPGRWTPQLFCHQKSLNEPERDTTQWNYHHDHWSSLFNTIKWKAAFWRTAHVEAMECRRVETLRARIDVS